MTDMRLFEFSCFINQFQSVQELKRCDVLYELLGQHYGLETIWLDVTNDFSTVLFFATCVWDKGRWRPLSHRDIERDECSKWGVIYRKSAARVGLDECMRMGKYIHHLHDPRPLLKDVGSNVPVPIGYRLLYEALSRVVTQYMTAEQCRCRMILPLNNFGLNRTPIFPKTFFT